jgi:hypothetical protein
MSDGKITYQIEANDTVSDVLGKVKRNFSHVGESARAVAQAFREGGWKAGVAQLKTVQVNGMAASPALRFLTAAINPATIAAVAAAAAFKLMAAGIKVVGAAINNAVVFQKHTFDLKALEGSYAAARQTMLALTEGKQAVDAEFGTDAVVKAYKNLYSYTNGALASANMVNLLGNRAKYTGRSIEEMSEVAGKAWQAISQGNGLGMAKEQLMNSMRIDASVIKELEDMQKAGASAGEVWLRLRDEIGKTRNTIRDSEGSIDRLNKTIADAKGTISRVAGEMFTPLVANLKYAQAFWLDAFATMISGSKQVREELEETARLREEEAMDRKQAEELDRRFEEARGRQAQRREDERFNAMPIWQLGQEAEKARSEGRVDDWEKLTELRDKKLAEAVQAQAKREEDARKALTDERQAQALAEADAVKEASRLADEQHAAAKAAADALAARKDELALDGMSPEDRAAELERRAAVKAAEAARIRQGRPDDKLTAVDLAAALKAELEALNLAEQAKGERAGIASLAAGDAAAESARNLGIKEAAEAARSELAAMGGVSTSSIDLAERTQWMRAVRAGRSPDEQIADNTRRIADLLEIIRKDGGLQ